MFPMCLYFITFDFDVFFFLVTFWLTGLGEAVVKPIWGFDPVTFW